MCDDRAVNAFDLFAILLVILAILLGFRSDALPQIGGLLGAVGGGALMVVALPVLVDPLGAVDPTVRPSRRPRPAPIP